MNKKILRTVCSFFIMTLHATLFGAVQASQTLISTQLAPHWFSLKMILYAVGITVSLLHPLMSNRLGQRRVLSVGLLCDALGMLCFLIPNFWLHSWGNYLFYLGTIFFGLAILSVFNCLIIYMIWDYPKFTVMAITALIAFANIGFLIDTVLEHLVSLFSLPTELFLFFTALLLFFSAIVSLLYEEPPFPLHVKYLRSGTLLWKELHIRLFFFLAATIFYSLTEGIFNFWGWTYLEALGKVANTPIAAFWIAMILGQFLLLIPLAYGNPYKILFSKVGLVAFALILLPFQTKVGSIYFSFVLGGLGTAGIFPIILALLEAELIHVALISRYDDFLPLIDAAISVMTAGYLFGGGVVDIWTGPFYHGPQKYPFFLGALFILICCSLMVYLNRTRPTTRSLRQE